MSEEKYSLVDLSALGEPAKALIERVSDAVGVFYEPARIRRRARAEADASAIQLASQLGLSELEARAARRMLHVEANRQKNIESITRQATEALGAGADPSGMDDHWIARFFERCASVSDELMQSLWARILAGEAMAPGAFSVRAIEMVSSMDKREAELFSALCGYCWEFPSEDQVELVPLVFEFSDPIYAENGITYAALFELDAIGLIVFDSMSGHVITNAGGSSDPSVCTAIYHAESRTFELGVQGTRHDVPTGCVWLTATGNQLAKIAEARSRFPDWLST